MATGSIGNVTTTKRTKSFVASGSITNDVIYTCPAGTYADVYIDGNGIVASGGATSISGSLFFALPIVGTSSIKTKQIATFAQTSGPTSIVVDPVYNQNGASFSNPASATNNLYVAIDGFGNRLVDGMLVTGNYNGSTFADVKVGNVFRLFAGEYLYANYTASNSGGGYGVLSITTIEVSSSV